MYSQSKKNLFTEVYNFYLKALPKVASSKLANKKEFDENIFQKPLCQHFNAMVGEIDKNLKDGWSEIRIFDRLLQIPESIFS